MKTPLLERAIEKKNFVIIYAILAIFILISLFFLVVKKVTGGWSLFLTCILDASIAALFVNVLIDIITGKDKDRKTSAMIREALIPEECPAEEMPDIYDIYKKDKLRKILKNTVKAYTCNDYLSNNYVSFIDGTYKTLKRDENYQVTICGKPNDGKNHIKQQLKATFVFKEPEEELFLKAFFVLKRIEDDKKINRELDRILNDNSYVFREEIEDEEFNALLKGLCSRNDGKGIIDALKLNISLFDKNGVENKVLADNMVIEPKKKMKAETGEEDSFYGIEVRVPTDKKEFVFPDNSTEDKGRYYRGEGYVRSTMYIEVEYPIPDTMNNFYLIYSRPTISSSFQLSFDGIDRYREDKVNCMSFLTYNKESKDAWDGVIKPNGTRFNLNAKGLLLPRSGAAFSWNFRKRLSKIEQSMMDSNLVDVQSINKEIDVKLLYSTTENFTGEDLYGGMEKAYLVPELAVMLAKVQEKLTADHPGYRLLVYDAARPQSIQAHMFNLVKDKYEKPEFYVSNPAKHGWHNYGAAVDVTIEDENGTPLDMGTPFDCFEPKAHIDKEDELVAQGVLSQEQKANRDLLRGLMKEEGFETIPTEWWHFQKYSKYELRKRFKLLNF